MKIIDCEQGSQEWKAIRLGIPTASCFKNLIQPSTLKPSGSSSKYLHQLIAEWILGCQLDDFGSGFTDRGTGMEDEAVRYYEFAKSVTVDRVGFCLHASGLCGGSPDGLVGGDGGLEIKCPSPAVHVAYLLGNVAKAHRMQVQGNLWITKRAWWDVLSYHPDMEKALVRVEPEPDVMAALDIAVPEFIEKLKAARVKMRELGMVPASERKTLELAEQDAVVDAAAEFYGIDVPR